jgi:hypothetical protein
VLSISAWATGDEQMYKKKLEEIRRGYHSELSFDEPTEAEEKLEEAGITRYFNG